MQLLMEHVYGIREESSHRDESGDLETHVSYRDSIFENRADAQRLLSEVGGRLTPGDATHYATLREIVPFTLIRNSELPPDSLTHYEFIRYATFDEDGGVTFDIAIDFESLVHNCAGISYLNECVDDFTDKGYLLADLTYEVARLVGSTCVVRVMADATEYLEEFSQTEEDNEND